MSPRDNGATFHVECHNMKSGGISVQRYRCGGFHPIAHVDQQRSIGLHEMPLQLLDGHRCLRRGIGKDRAVVIVISTRRVGGGWV